MNNLVKRALILLIFGAAFAVSILAVDLIISPRQKKSSALQQEAETTAPAQQAPNPEFFLPPAPPAASPPAVPVEKKGAGATPDLPSPVSRMEPSQLREAFASGVPVEEAYIDVAQTAAELRAHVERNHPSLKLSDREYDRLAESIGSFREANLKMKSLERSSENSPAIRRAMQQMATAMQDFRQITGMTQGEFFLGEDAPVKFGEDERPGKNEELVVDYLPDGRS
ncbi:MAG: hypothetical protein C4520_12770 [Candidatus Abyssobacteria bacterium SURF_5]|uniref:Uncharacterized protein n=1 Tax=Abyssobacteria bacterium (strain SURF_5) TaxID=2093360 RepID=A0A3A4NKB0_ABYX5|nr:MAG: hypothetical protein C4520_12770 [Candidatus Abyssubacteria bacterium SURF_5]